MNDFDKAANLIGSRFDLVLIASERMRELHKIRRLQEEMGNMTLSQRRSQVIPAYQAITDIENNAIGREYLGRVKIRARKKKPKFDEI